MANEFAMVQFLEANGVDVSYISGIDTDRFGTLLTNHRTFISVGHDEYWSGAQRTNVEHARDAGVNLAFFGGNDVYWRTRYEPSIDGGATGYRTIVCYKETWDNAKIDPTTEWTGTFRDPRFPSAIGSNQPENGLIGTRYISNSGQFAIKVPADYAALRFWRGTSVASLTGSQTATLAPDTLGYEFNDAPTDSSRPPGLISLSRTTAAISQYLADYGSTVLPGVATHNLTLYRASSGALVFSAGTIQWSWGLGMKYDGGPQPASQPMQQATLNVLADMSVPATTPLSGLVAASRSTDDTAPVAAITGSSTGSGSGSRTVVTGTATDAGGVVAGVEVSTDNGVSWSPASGTSDWSHTFDAKGVRTMQVRARAIDDSGNIGATTDPTEVTSTCPCTMLGSQTPAILGSRDNAATNGLELGLRFRPSTAGTATALRFFRGVGDSSTHVGRLYRSDGALLAQATFPPSTGQGWEEAALTNPVALCGQSGLRHDHPSVQHLLRRDLEGLRRRLNHGLATHRPGLGVPVWRWGRDAHLHLSRGELLRRREVRDWGAGGRHDGPRGAHAHAKRWSHGRRT